MSDEFKLIEEEYKKFRDKILGNGVDVEAVDKAWNFAVLAHHGQKRKTGEPFVLHPLEVARTLYEWKLDTDSLVAGLLHDSVEDGGATKEDLSKEFGISVATLVDGVTKISDIRLKGSKSEEFVENLRKMFLAMAKDLRVVLIKLADRLHNMKTLIGVEAPKRKRIAEETLEIYAPLAERLGMGQIKSELDDLAFPYVYPEAYEKVVKLAKPYIKNAELHVKKMRRSILESLAKAKIKGKVSGRKKHLYSLWKKLERPEVSWDLNEIHDVIALRVIVNTIPECYTVLGIVHSLFKPVPHIGVSDFIAQPKPNGYRSIHTKVFGIKGRIMEIQIRTYDMHQQAEYGIAAHWAYSEAKDKKVTRAVRDDVGVFAPSEKLSWIKQLISWQREIKDKSEFLEAVKFDALSERIFVFSPIGDVYDLPAGATPVDFAFAVHTNLAEYVKAVKANGKVVPFNYHLKSGDVVEILKSKYPKNPPRDWLDYVVTTTAKREISKYYRIKS